MILLVLSLVHTNHVQIGKYLCAEVWMCLPPLQRREVSFHLSKELLFEKGNSTIILQLKALPMKTEQGVHRDFPGLFVESQVSCKWLKSFVLLDYFLDNKKTRIDKCFSTNYSIYKID